MSLLTEHFWKLILLLMVTVGGWLGYDQWSTAQAWDHVVLSYKSDLEAVSTNPTATEDQSFGNYWRLLANLHQYQLDVEAGLITPRPLKDANDAANPGNPEASGSHALPWLFRALTSSERGSEITIEALRTNFATCQQLGVFESESNLLLMSRGQPPVLEKGPYRDEKLLITPRVPLLVAREAVHYPANFTLVPESVAALEPSEIDDATKQLASKLKQANLLSQRTMDGIIKLYEQAKH